MSVPFLASSHPSYDSADEFLFVPADEKSRPSLFQRALGYSRGEVPTFTWWMTYCQKAIEAEKSGQWDKADFYWRELLAEWRPYNKGADFWKQLHQQLGEKTATFKDGQELECHQLKTYLDLHGAFYNGYVSQVSPQSPLTSTNRAFAHLDYMTKWLEYLCVVSPDYDALPIVGLGLETHISLQEEEKKTADALRTANRAFQLFPGRESYALKAAQLELDWGAELATIDALTRATHRIEFLRQRYPRRLEFYWLLGDLYKRKAIKQGDTLHPSDALLSLAYAQQYCFPVQQLASLEADLNEKLHRLGEMMAELKKELRRRGAQLNAEGHTLDAQVRAGINPANKFRSSAMANAIRSEAIRARNHNLWESITGARAPQTAEGDASVFELGAIIDAVFKKVPSNSTEIQAAWVDASADKTGLPESMGPQLVEWLSKVLFAKGGSWSQPYECLATSEEQQRKSAKFGFSPPLSPATEPLIITPLPKEKQPGEERTDEWFWSRQSKRIRLQVALAGLLVAAGLGVGGREFLATRARNASFNQVVSAQIDSPKGVAQILDGAELFLSRPSLQGPDSRRWQVAGLYKQALVRYVAAREAKSDAVANRLEQYRTLVTNNKSLMPTPLSEE